MPAAKLVYVGTLARGEADDGAVEPGEAGPNAARAAGAMRDGDSRRSDTLLADDIKPDYPALDRCFCHFSAYPARPFSCCGSG